MSYILSCLNENKKTKTKAAFHLPLFCKHPYTSLNRLKSSQTFYRLLSAARRHNLCTNSSFDALLKRSSHVFWNPKLPTRNSLLASEPAAFSSHPPPVALMTCGRKHQKLPTETDENRGGKREKKLRVSPFISGVSKTIMEGCVLLISLMIWRLEQRSGKLF